MSSLSVSNSFSTVVIDQTLITDAVELVNSRFDFLTNHSRKVDPDFHFYNGKHCTVFSHTRFPNKIFKIMSNAQASESKESLDKARQAFGKYRFCHAPQGEIAPLPKEGRTLFIMEKAVGMTNEHDAKEAMEQEFEKIDIDTTIAEKWRCMTRELAEATAEIGYWDSQRKNLIWDSEKGWSFIDFETIDPSSSHIQTGLERLIDIVPYQFVGEVYDVAGKNGVSLKNGMGLAQAQAARKAQFEFSRVRSLRDKEKGVPRKLDLEKWSTDSWERRILEQFKERRESYVKYGSPEFQTELQWQPFCFSGNWGIDCDPRILPDGRFDDKATDLSKYHTERAAFEQALQHLKEEGTVLSWKTDPYYDTSPQPWLVLYNIYF